MIELYDHQKEAVAKLKNGNILVGDVGSGKSATSIAYYIQHESMRDLYIITTAKKRDSMDWEDELIEFRLGLNPEYNQNHVKITIDSWNNISKYQRVIGAFFIFDEQRVIGKGAWVKSFLKIARANHWILLSATPGDTYEDYIPVFVANGFYRNRTEFLQQHAVYNPYTPYRKIEDFVDKRRLNFYRHQIVVRMKDTRKTKRIPVKVITDYDKTLYKTIWKDRWNPYDNEPITTAANVCYLLRRVVNSDQSRINKLHELLERHPKVIIFYNYDYELEILHNNLTLWDIPYSEWNGHRHEEIITGDCWAYLVQYSAGAEAWNCIETNVIIFYSQTYSYKTKEQASGRIDRMNTPYHELYYYNMVSFAPIDVAISRSLQMKKNFNVRLFVGER
ncbi:MAG: DEAD/DEAH box helicase family protein [Clostridiales bacterium]|nr:DEAD/DEAH box helicase family protein [Clostridiales bacterium]